jgi:hypothetical protein
MWDHKMGENSSDEIYKELLNTAAKTFQLNDG